MTRPTYYSFNPDTGEYTGSGQADASPREKDVWLFPANCTTVPVIAPEEGKVRVFSGEGWTKKDDFRGSVWYDKGLPVVIDFIGDPIERGLTASPPVDVPEDVDPVELTDEELVNIERDNLNVSPIEFNGHVFEADPTSRRRLDSARLSAVIAIVSGAVEGDYRWHGHDIDFVWIDIDNVKVNMDAFEVVALGNAVAAREGKLILKAREIKDAEVFPADFAEILASVT